MSRINRKENTSLLKRRKKIQAKIRLVPMAKVRDDKEMEELEETNIPMTKDSVRKRKGKGIAKKLKKNLFLTGFDAQGNPKEDGIEF